jgi:heme-degrading monooxygenase HmoA
MTGLALGSRKALLKNEVFVGIRDRRIRGYRGIHLFRHDSGDEVEFMTVMWFASLQAARELAGANREAAVVPAAARALLLRFDQRSQHYEVKVELTK